MLVIMKYSSASLTRVDRQEHSSLNASFRIGGSSSVTADLREYQAGVCAPGVIVPEGSNDSRSPVRSAGKMLRKEDVRPDRDDRNGRLLGSPMRLHEGNTRRSSRPGWVVFLNANPALRTGLFIGSRRDQSSWRTSL